MTGETGLRSLRHGYNAIVIGASGAIGGALADRISADPACASLTRTGRTKPADRSGWMNLDLEDEAMIAGLAAKLAERPEGLDLVIVATGLLHNEPSISPEKSWRHINVEALAELFRVNAIGPALIAKHLLPLLPRQGKSVFACLSARVGSIGDNRLGGWYGYRASKAALNMMIRSLSIELARTRPDSICCGLHPGTVRSPLSDPFLSGRVRPHSLPPEEAAGNLLRVIDGLDPGNSGHVFAWDGSRIPD